MLGRKEGVAIAGEDNKFIWANASMDDKTIVVRSDKVPKLMYKNKNRNDDNKYKN